MEKKKKEELFMKTKSYVCIYVLFKLRNICLRIRLTAIKFKVLLNIVFAFFLVPFILVRKDENIE